MMSKILLVLPFLFMNFAPCFASDVDDATFGFGSLTNYVGKIQTDDQGHTRQFDFSPFFSTTMKWKFYKKFSFVPEIGIGIPEKGADDNINRFQYHFISNIGHNFYDFTSTFGMGFSFTRLSSKGGTETLSNGLGSTDFPVPDFTSTSRNFILTLGADYILFQSWAAHLKIISFNITDKYKRSFSYLIGLNYHFGEFDWNFK